MCAGWGSAQQQLETLHPGGNELEELTHAWGGLSWAGQSLKKGVAGMAVVCMPTAVIALEVEARL